MCRSLFSHPFLPANILLPLLLLLFWGVLLLAIVGHLVAIARVSHAARRVLQTHSLGPAQGFAPASLRVARDVGVGLPNCKLLMTSANERELARERLGKRKWFYLHS